MGRTTEGYVFSFSLDAEYTWKTPRHLKMSSKSSNTTFKERQLHRHKKAERSYSSFVRRGSREGIPLVQGKEQRLHFVGPVVKRYSMSKVRETQVTR